jgi:hypothetical protein
MAHRVLMPTDMIGRMIVAIGGAALALVVAHPAHALECEPGEVVVQDSGWRGQHLSSPGLIALPGRALVWWQSDTVKGALVDGDAVTARSALGRLPDLYETAVAATPAVTLVVGHDPVDGIIAQRLSADGALLGERHYLTYGEYYSTVSVATDGTSFLVAWTEATVGSESGAYLVRAATISPDGMVSAVRDLAYTARGIGLHAVRTGDVTRVLWSGTPTGENDGIFGLRLDGDGAPLDETPQRLSADRTSWSRSRPATTPCWASTASVRATWSRSTPTASLAPP